MLFDASDIPISPASYNNDQLSALLAPLPSGKSKIIISNFSAWMPYRADDGLLLRLQES